MSRLTNPLQPTEAFLIGLLSRHRQSPSHPVNLVKAAKLHRLGEIAVMIGSERSMAIAVKLFAITKLGPTFQPLVELERSSQRFWLLPAEELLAYLWCEFA